MKQIRNEQTEKDLFDALSFANIGELPKKHDGRSKRVWTKCILEVQKKNGVISYAIAHNIDDEKIKIKKTFGETSQIIIEEGSYIVYPYEWLSTENVPDKEGAQKFLEKYSEKTEEELSILDAPEKGKLLKETSIKLQNNKK